MNAGIKNLGLQGVMGTQEIVDTLAVTTLTGRLVSIERGISDRTTVTFEGEDKKRFYIGGLSDEQAKRFAKYFHESLTITAAP